MLRGLGFLLILGLTVYALIDCVRADDSDVKGLPKIVWVLLIVLVTPVGPIVWLVAGRDRNPRPQLQRHPTAPDDDPEFLRRLSENRRQQAEDERLRQWEAELRDQQKKEGEEGGEAGRS